MDADFAHPILTCAEAKAWEARLLRDERAEWAAMQRAGKAVAQGIEDDFGEIGGLPERARLLVLVGKGHNGGDALLAAAELLRRLPRATAAVVLVFGAAALRPLARKAWRQLRRSGGRRVATLRKEELADVVRRYDVAIDGIFGFQFRPPMDTPTRQLIATVNAHPAIKLRAAVDLPSGLATGANDSVLRADFTYATGIVKAPLLEPAAAAAVGRVRYLDLGFFEKQKPVTDHVVFVPEAISALGGLRDPRSDKRTFGHLFVVGGSRSYPGAVLMAVQAALRSGVGLLTAFVPKSLAAEYAARLPEAMWVGCPETRDGGLAESSFKVIEARLPRAKAFVVGPGLGTAKGSLRLAQRILREGKRPAVLDADALRPEVVSASRTGLICTPHAGEFQRLGGRGGFQPALKINAAVTGVVVLKGYPTRVFEFGQVKTGPTYHGFSGGPVLARGGSGDILAGLIGGLLAQKPDDLLLAASRGVVWHGLAADLLARDQGQVAVQTTQLLDYLQRAILHAANASSQPD